MNRATVRPIARAISRRARRPLTSALLASLAVAGALAWGASGGEALAGGEPVRPPLRSGSELDYPPLALGEIGGEARGFSVDLARALCEAMGRRVDFRVAPWSELKDDLKAGRVDFLPLVGYSLERDKDFDFTTAYLTVHGAIFVQPGSSVRRPADLAGARVAVMRADVMDDYLRTYHPDAIAIRVDSVEDALRRLRAGHCDAALALRLVGLQLLRDRGWEGVKTVGPPIEEATIDWCMAVREGDRALLRTLNEGLLTVKADGTLQRLRAKWLGVLPKEGPPLWRWWLWIPLALLAGVLLTGGGAYLWQRSLRRRVRERTRALGERDALMSAFAEALPDLAFLFDRDGRYLDVLGRREDLLYRPRAEVIGKRAHDLLPVGLADRVLHGIHATLQDGAVHALEYQLDVGGAPHWFEARLTLVRGGSGRADLVLCLASDITERRVAEDGLRESEARFRALFEHSHAVMLLIDPVSGDIIDANPSACAYYGWPPDTLRTMTIHDINPMPKAELAVLMEEAREKKQRFFRFQHRLASGEIRDVDVYSGPVDVAGRRRLFSIVHDVTDRLRAEDALRQSEARYRLLFERAGDAILILEAEGGRIAMANPAATTIFGRPLEALRGMPWSTLREPIPPPHAPGDSILGRGVEWLARANGESFPAEVGVHDFEVDGGPSRMVVVRDVTERFRAERILRESEERHRILLRASRTMAVLLSPAGRIQDYLEWARELTGRELSEVITHDFATTFLPNDQRVEFDQALRELAQGRPFQNAAYTLLTRRGPLPVVMNAVLRKEETHGENAVLLAAQDVSDIAAAQQARDRAESRLQRILEQVEVMLFGFDGQGHLTYVTENVTSLLGVAPGDLSRLAEKAPAGGGDVPTAAESGHEDAPIDLETFLDTLREGLGVGGEACLRHRESGEAIWVRYQSTPMLGEGGSPRGVIGLAQVITEERQSREEGRRLRERLYQSEKMEALGQLAGGLAHDFNNLLTTIATSAELMLERGGLNEKQDRYLRAILGATSRGADLNRNILGFARKSPPVTVPVDLHELIDGMSDILRHTLDRRIELVVEAEAGQSYLMGDPNTLQHSLLNLAVNARDAMPDGGRLVIRTEVVKRPPPAAQPRIEHPQRGWIRVAVRDNGLGMSPEVRSRVLEPFFTTKPEGQGTGLGLSSVFGAVQAHGGCMEMQSTLGEGTEIALYLPLGAPDESDFEESDHDAFALGTGRILVVDDEETLRENLRESLGLLGYEVATARDGGAALAWLEENGAADLVLLDMVMPRQNGLEVMRAIRARDPEQPILLLTGFAEDEVLRQALAEGAAGMVQKPVRVRSLSHRIAKVLDAVRDGTAEGSPSETTGGAGREQSGPDEASANSPA